MTRAAVPVVVGILVLLVLGGLLPSAGPGAGLCAPPTGNGSRADHGAAPVATYAVTFTESGLAAGVSWAVALSGSAISSTSGSIAFTEPNGTFNFSVTGAAGWRTSAPNGSVTVAGAAESVTVPWIPVTYPVTFSESGLLAGTSWVVTVGSVPVSSINQTIVVPEPNGSYTYHVGSVAGYSLSPSSATFTVAGAAVVRNVTYRAVSGSTYTITFTENGLPTGTTWGVTLGGSTATSTGASLAYLEPAGTWTYDVSNVSGWHAGAYSGSVKVIGGAASVTVNWTMVTYSVTFAESGLPTGTSWTVTLSGTLVPSTNRSIAFVEPNGTYPYQLSDIAGWRAGSYQGSVSVSGSSAAVAVTWTQTTYPLTFTESGLASGTSWTVTVGGGPRSSSGTSLSFPAANGSYAYTVTPVPGYSTSPAAATIAVNGGAVAQAVTFAPIHGATYTLSFSESGLPNGASWSVTLNGTSSVSTRSSSVAYTEPNGTFDYTVGKILGWRASPSSGSVAVSGGSSSVDLSWSAATYPVSFTETGLPTGASWTVTVGGTPSSSTTSTISLAEPNGTWNYTVSVIPGWHASAYSGVVTVDGAAASVSLGWTIVTYSLSFTESGLPSGTAWTVTAGTAPLSSSNRSVVFAEPNGSYAYSVTAISGYSISPAAATLVVNGSSVGQAIAFANVPGATYLVTVSESGLPSGTVWSVTVGGVTATSAGASASFREPNGALAYSVAGIAGWRANPASGSVTVSGASASATVTWTQVTYSVTFTETGLPAGTSWGVTLGGSSTRSANSSLSFLSPNGSYLYNVSDVPGHRANAYSGTVSVNGAPQSVSLTWTEVAYPVSFTESGLPLGTTWLVDLSNTLLSSTGRSISLSEPNGTYAYSLPAIPGWVASSYSGSLTVAGGPASVSISWTQISYTVTFTESGLPGGTTWGVTLGGTATSAANASISFSKPNGTFVYSLSGIPGWRAAAYGGSVTVNGKPATVAVSWSRVTYFVTFTESGLASGTAWTVTLGGSPSTSSTTSVSFSEPNGSYAYAITPVAGYSTAPASATVAVSGVSLTQAIVFAAASGSTYAVTFTESGLSSGTAWTVALAGVAGPTTASSVSFLEPNGTFAYSVTGGGGLRPTPSSGSVTVAGKSGSVSVAWSQQTYSVTITETGLPSGTSWSATIGGSPGSSLTNTIVFSEPNGTLNYTISNVPGWRASLYAGTVKVTGGPAFISVTWTVTTFAVVFTESGLPNGSTWYVLLGTNPGSSTTTTITLSEPNGTFNYRVQGVPGYRTSSYTGSVTVAGATVAVAVSWSRVTYTLTFSESGLPSGTSWSVNVAGTPYSSLGTSITVSEPNGTFNYSLSGIAGWRPNAYNGSVTLIGGPATVTVTWRQVTYPVTFTESGLPSGTTWGVNVGGSLATTTNGSLTIAEPNGSFGYRFSNVAGWRPNPGSGTFDVNGGALALYVGWTETLYTVTFSESGLPTGTSWGVSFQGSAITTSNASISFPAPNGTLSYKVLGVPGWRAGAYTGSVTVNGQNASTVVGWSIYTWAVTFTESGLAPGTSWSVTLSGTRLSSSTASIVFQEPNGTFAFVVAGVLGYRTNSYSGAVTVNGWTAGVTVAWSAMTYRVLLTESGLPTGTSWSAMINGTLSSSTNSTILFSEPNGTFTYQLLDVPGWQTSPRSGSVTVAGKAVSVAVAWSEPTYQVVFTEAGLPDGTYWDVTLGGTLLSSTSVSIAFTEPNGTFSYFVSALSGWSTAGRTGSVTVAGASTGVTLSWREMSYSVTFTESGLPIGTSWAVALMGLLVPSVNRSIAFLDPNGSVHYEISGVPGYHTPTYSGVVTIDGGPVVVSVNWTESTYPVRVTETGLPTGTSWTVTLAGSATTSTATSVSFTEPNGTFGFSLSNVSSWHTRSLSGTVTVNGGPAGVTVVWYQLSYTVTFTESGLAPGTPWTVTLGGSVATSTNGTITLAEPNGSYAYTIGTVGGYSASTTSGSVTVSAGPVAQPVDFRTVSSGPSFLGASGTAGMAWAVAAILATAAALVLLLLFMRARRGRRPAPNPWRAPRASEASGTNAPPEEPRA